MNEIDKTLQSNGRFDPFTDRTARDIRNSLSEAFVEAIAIENPHEYLKIAQQWRKQNLSSLHADYIDDRLLRYENVLNAIQAGEITDPLQQAVAIWNEGLYFEFHDHLERIWQQTAGDEHEALKGLIKAAGAYIHMESNRQQAAERLSTKSVNLIRRYSHCLKFITNLNVLTESIKDLNPVPPKLRNPALPEG